MGAELDDYLAGSGSQTPVTVKRTKGGWQQAGQLAVGGGTPVTMQFDFGEVDTYTVGFQQPYVQAPSGDDIGVRAEALIMWNVDGSYKPVQVSLIGGMSVTAPARGVKIIMNDATLIGAAFPPVGTLYNVSAQVARGTRGFSAVAPYWIPFALASGIAVSPNSSGNANVPPNAGIQSLYVSPTFTSAAGTAVQPGDTLVSQFSRSALGNPRAASLAIGAFDPQTSTNAKWIPVIPGCTFLSLANNNNSNSIRFSIAFGVDG